MGFKSYTQKGHSRGGIGGGDLKQTPIISILHCFSTFMEYLLHTKQFAMHNLYIAFFNLPRVLLRYQLLFLLLSKISL